MTHSAIYRGVVEHARHTPVEHTFRYRLYMLWLDLDEIESLFARRWLWSHERFNFVSFRRADYLGEAARPLRECVLDEVENALGRRPEGAIRMLTQPRCLGVSFNPVSFYYCYDAEDRLDAIVAEITNTPWNERHSYVVGADGGNVLRRKFDKDFHISPFMSMDQQHDWRFSTPGETLGIHMRNIERGDRMFDATLSLDRRPWNGRELAKALVFHPFMTGKVLFGIYFQALRLKLKGAPFFSHPATVPAEATR